MDVLGNRYQLQDPIGRGSSCTVYRGLDLHMDRVVAIKMLREVYSTNPKFVRRFQSLTKAMCTLLHPNIVYGYDYGQTDGHYYVVMELVEGIDLRRYLHSRGILEVDRAVSIARDIALGLGEMHHHKIVYRELKLQKVLVSRGGSIKLVSMGVGIGNFTHNRPPEQESGEIVTPATDVYALGIVIYEMLTGRTPFDRDNAVAVVMQHIQEAPTTPSQLNPNIPPDLDEIILKCLEKVPEMRFVDGSELARALESYNVKQPSDVE